MKFVFALVAAAAAMLFLDAIWLSTMAERLYRPELGDLLADQFRPYPAFVFYALYLIGVVYFAVYPALLNGGWRITALNGALFGLIAYGTYDLTNQATLRHWPVLVTVLDMIWGAVISTAAAIAGYAAARPRRSPACAEHTGSTRR